MRFGPNIALGPRYRPTTEAVAYTPLLEAYPNSFAAYSLNLLDSNYTGDSIVVTRSGDLLGQPIGFDANGDLDEQAIINWCGPNLGYVSTVYDQSGNGEHVSNTNVSRMPLIYDGSAVVKYNGKPAMYFDGTKWLYRAYFKQTYSQPNTFAAVANVEYVPTVGRNLFDGYGGSRNSFFVFDNTDNFALYAGLIADSNLTAVGLTNQFITVGTFNSSTSNLRLNNQHIINAGSVGSQPFLGINFGTYSNTSGTWLGHIQTLVFWNSDLFGQSVGISSNLNTYYSSY